MDLTLIVAAHVYCFCMFSSVFLPLILLLFLCWDVIGLSLGNRKFGVCEGFPYLGGQVTTPESLYLRSSDYPRLLHSIAPPVSCSLHLV
jgi:hypothetical protein